MISGPGDFSKLENRPLKPSHIANKPIISTHSKHNKEPITNSVTLNEPAGGSVTNSTPTLELMHKDNQTIFTLSSLNQDSVSSTPPGGAVSGSHSRSDSRISTDSQSMSQQSEHADNNLEFQSIEKRRSKLMETFAAKSPNEQPGVAKTRPIMEVKPRPTSTSSDTNQPGRQVLKGGSKPVFPKPSVKPKPAGKKLNAKKQQGIQQVVNEALSLIDTNRVGWTNELDPFLR